MLSIESTFHEIEHALLKENKGTKVVANEMGVGENKLRRILRVAGFEYDASTKKWEYVVLDESKDVRNMSFWAFDEQLKGNTGNTKPKENHTSNTKSNKSNIPSNNNNTVLPFTADEIEALKELAQLHINKPIKVESDTAPAHTDDKLTAILERIKGLESKAHERKTFIIETELIKQFDAFCSAYRLKKSDVMSIAIIDLLEKYR